MNSERNSTCPQCHANAHVKVLFHRVALVYCHNPDCDLFEGWTEEQRELVEENERILEKIEQVYSSDEHENAGGRDA